MKNVKTVASLIGTVFSTRTAMQRMRQVREEGSDKLELLDALLNIAVVITGAVVVVRRLREGKTA